MDPDETWRPGTFFFKGWPHNPPMFKVGIRSIFGVFDWILQQAKFPNKENNYRSNYFKSVPRKFTLIDLNEVKVESICILTYQGLPPLKEFWFILSTSQQSIVLGKSFGIKSTVHTVKRIKSQTAKLGENICKTHIP